MALQHKHFAVFFLLVVILNRSSKSAEVKNQQYRLSNDVVPVNYNVKLTLHDDFATRKSFEGTVDITLKTIAIDATQNYKNVVTLHINSLEVKAGKLVLYKLDDPLKENRVKQNNPFKVKEKLDMLDIGIDDNKPLEANSTYMLKVTYTGRLHDDMRGFYLSSYSDNGKREWIATTQFQATFARRAFPCFDEPNFKATFDISIVHPKEYQALSNTESITRTIPSNKEQLVTTFEQTPIMSTYLIAFVVSKFASISGFTDSLHNSVWSRREVITTAGYAFDITPKALKAMEEFTGVPYTDSGLTKLDQVAIPDFSSGAMENWGLATYRETALLWDPVESTARNKQRVCTVVTHEITHMWFGNLITMDWWSSTWLNEGFAKYFEYHAADKVEASWELKYQFVVEQHQRVYNHDSFTTVQAMTSDAFTPAEISAKFSTISYAKGATVIRMMEHFMGTQNFFKGIKEYFRKGTNGNRFKTTKPRDLWKPMSKHAEKSLPQRTTLEDIMKRWTENSGFPVVTVTAKKRKIFCESKRFLFDNTTEDSVWHIPISYATSKNPDFTKTAPKKWLKPNQTISIDFELTPDSWIIFNVQVSAYIRVNYDKNLWKALQDALQQNHHDIHVLNRAQLVDDAMNLARASIISYVTAMDVISYLRNEKEYYPWFSAFRTFTFLRRRIGVEDELLNYIDKYILNLMQDLYSTVSFAYRPKTQVESHKKVITLTWACLLGNLECIKRSQTLFSFFEETQTPIDPDLRSIVYCNSLRNSDGDEDWLFLRKRLTKTRLSTEVVTIITALGCTRKEHLLKSYLKESIDPTSGIRKQDAQSVFTAVISGNPEAIPIALDFFINNYKEIHNNYGGMNALSGVIDILADSLTTKEQIKKFEKFIKDPNIDLGDAYEAAKSAVESCEENLKWVQSFREELLEYLKEKFDSSTTTTEEDDEYTAQTTDEYSISENEYTTEDSEDTDLAAPPNKLEDDEMVAKSKTIPPDSSATFITASSAIIFISFAVVKKW